MNWTFFAETCCQRTDIPIPQIAFIIIGSILAIYSYNLTKHYRENHNPLALLHVLLTLFGAISFYSLSVPFVLTTDHTVLLWADYFAVTNLTIFFIVLSRILWFGSLRTKLRFRYIGIPVALIGAATLASDILQTNIDSTNYPATYVNATSSLWLKCILFTVVMLPGALWYLWQALRIPDNYQKLRLSVIGIMMLAISLSIISENIISRGKGTIGDSVVRLIAGLAMLLVITFTRKKKSKVPAKRP